MTKIVIETPNGWYMENEKEKVELEDIIGLIKTDEPTDSVQLKKEAQLSICEKRVLELAEENEQLKHCIKKLQNELNIYSEVFNELNALVDDNEQLKQQVEDLEFKLRTIKAYDRTVKEEHSDTVYDFQKKLEQW